MSISLLRPTYICRACRIRTTRQSHRFVSSEARRSTRLPDGPVRTRFAPSPTGYLHFGSVRTALFNYLIAKRTGGQFLLRIEDTDRKRTISGAEKRILNDLRWLGLQWDEGPEVGGPYGPYRQSERSALYKTHAEQLINSGHAYRCFCSEETLHAKGQQRSQSGLATLYDRTCYHIPCHESNARAANDESFVVRFKAEDKSIRYTDIVGGPYSLPPTAAKRAAAQGAYDDFILMKADGLPTYHFANVIDDYHMKITHVIRGVEWQISTPKHLSLYDAFGWTPPAIGHIGLLLNEDGTKMSKRDKTFDLHAFKEDGVLPEALVNFLALHGWSHTQRSDYMTLEDLEGTFDLNLSNTNPTVSLAKLWFLAPKHAIQRVEESSVEGNGSRYQEMLNMVCNAVQKTMSQQWLDKEKLAPGLEPHQNRAYVDRVLRADAKNYITAKEFTASHSYFFLREPENIKPLNTEPWKIERIQDTFLKDLKPLATTNDKWEHDALAEVAARAINNISTTPEDSTKQIKKKEIWQVLRAVLTGGQKGPSLIETMEILGPDVVMERIATFNSSRNIPLG